MAYVDVGSAEDYVVGERPGSCAKVLRPRDVPLGGVRAMTVRRTLPQRGRSFIGPWCFADHYGPDDVGDSGGMRVPPHPHTGLQTVSWLFSGEIEHRDSLGTHSTVRPGELNLMTAGHGISHSEDSTPATTTLHGVQLWVALPAAHRDTAPAFEHVVPPVVALGQGEVRVFLGTLAGSTSPARTFSPLVGAELRLSPGAGEMLTVDPTFEHGYLVDTGDVRVDGTPAGRGELVYVPPGSEAVVLRAGAGGARVVLLGGAPLGERIVMWWNFIGRDHADVVRAREQWQAEIAAPDAAQQGEAAALDVPAAAGDGSRFGAVTGQVAPPLPAPPLPNHRLLPRG